MFKELDTNELYNTEGGFVLELIGCVIAVGTAIYGLGYAHGQNDGYKDKGYSGV